MLTREVREWLQKVERRQYSYEDAMYEFMHFAKFLTKEELSVWSPKPVNKPLPTFKNRFYPIPGNPDSRV